MEIERQRVFPSPPRSYFEYRNTKINILDTRTRTLPKNTYRTLTAVDSVIVVIDVAKGVEAQTENWWICRMRKTPIMVFINKMDREGLDGFDLLDDLEQNWGSPSAR